MREENPYKSILPYLISGGLLLVTVLAVIPLKGTPMRYIWAMVMERGPFPYGSLFFGYLNAVVAFALFSGGGDRREGLNALAVLSFAPLLLGLFGTILGYHYVVNGVVEFMSGGCYLSSIRDVAENVRAGARTAWDPTILGGAISVINYALWFMVRRS